MISLSITRDALTPPTLPLSIADTGTGTYVLVSFDPGVRLRDNAVARSRWIDGGQLVSSRVDLLTLELVVRINAASTTAVITAADALDDALGQFGYTISRTLTGELTPTTYTCMPATTALSWDPVQLRKYTALFTASIPRQP